MVFHWSLGDSKFPQVSRILLFILVVLNNAVVWIVSTRPPTSSPPGPLSICREEENLIFVSARYLIQHWISPNQDDLSHSARTFISG